MNGQAVVRTAYAGMEVATEQGLTAAVVTAAGETPAVRGGGEG